MAEGDEPGVVNAAMGESVEMPHKDMAAFTASAVMKGGVRRDDLLWEEVSDEKVAEVEETYNKAKNPKNLLAMDMESDEYRANNIIMKQLTDPLNKESGVVLAKYCQITMMCQMEKQAVKMVKVGKSMVPHTMLIAVYKPSARAAVEEAVRKKRRAAKLGGVVARKRAEYRRALEKAVQAKTTMPKVMKTRALRRSAAVLAEVKAAMETEGAVVSLAAAVEKQM